MIKNGPVTVIIKVTVGLTNVFDWSVANSSRCEESIDGGEPRQVR